VLAAEHLLLLGRLHLGLQGVEGPRQVAADLLAGPGPLEQDAEVLDLARERPAQLDVVGQAAAPLQRLLRLLLVLPEIGRGDLVLEDAQLTRGLGVVKDSSADPGPASAGPVHGERDRQR
jgi:hypothetical protein